jgi:predicted aspartyl protease
MSYRQRKIVLSALVLAIVLSLSEAIVSGKDLVLEGVYEAALDLPRILFLLKRVPDGAVLKYQGRFEQNWAFVDTGASGVLLSRETANQLALELEPKARFVDVGVGGEEYFDVSEPLYIGLADYEESGSYDPNVYKLVGPLRLQVKKGTAGLLVGAVDVVGMPALAGRILVLDSGATNNVGYFAASINERGDPAIPKSDIVIAFRYENFLHPSNPKNVPPLPAMFYNPVIDNIVISYMGRSSKGNWLFDTGATISLISTEQAKRLGLINEDGEAKREPDFSVPMGGVGAMIEVPGFEIDYLRVPTVSGNNLVFKKARLGVHDIRFFDEKRGEFVVLDGIFGSNFLCASAKMEGVFPVDISKTAFEKIVIDMHRGLLGFDVRDGYMRSRGD